jgi:hypothetical protein
MLLGLMAFSHAQLKISLQFESAAPREVFVASELPNTAPATTVKAGGASLDYSVPAFGGTDRIYVWDRTTNNIASKPIKDITGNVWAPKAADYNLIGNLTVHVEHKGQAVQAAKVNLSTKGKSDEKLLDPSAKGDVSFFGYPTGDLHVKVSFNATDKQERSQEQIFPEAAKRDKPEPVLSVSIPDEVATISEAPGTQSNGTQGTTPAGGQAAKQPAKAEEGGGGGVGSLVLMFIALLVIGGAAYAFYHVITKKPKQFEETLQKLGVQIPNQQDPAAGAPIPVTPLPPAAPAPKIMLDDAEPTPLVGAVAVAPPTPIAIGGEPTLVKETGERTELMEGETVVGREDGLGLSLAGESTVSRRHATVTRTGRTTVVKDLGSTNGTFVNGTRLQGETTLKPGDQVQFGSVRFRYEG